MDISTAFVKCTCQFFVKSFYSLGIAIISLLIYLSSYREISSIPEDAEFDYIIVGAGTAGSTILLNIPQDSKVLVLEAGYYNFNYLFDIPVMGPILQRSLFDWSYNIQSQNLSCKAMKRNSCKWPAGRGFGGSNILNNMIYYRNHAEDFRGWFTDSDEYDYEKDILPYFIENEKILQLEEFKLHTDFSKAFFEEYELDSKVEFFKPNITQHGGMRWSIAHHYIAHFGKNQQNHKIVLQALVTKILFHDGAKNEDISTPSKIPSKHVAYGVEFEKNNLKHKAFASKAVILSAGAIGTPKILLQSGIGPCKDLEIFSIECHEDLPVGENLQDHVLTGLDLITLNTTAGLSIFDVISPKSLFQFASASHGPLTSIGCDLIGFLKTSSNVFPDLGFMVIPLGISTDFGMCLKHNFNLNENVWEDYFNDLTHTPTVSITPILLHPKSRGHIKLSSNDPKIGPIINPKYLSHKDDVRLLIKGIRYVQSFLRNPKIQKFGAQIYGKHFPGCENLKFDSDEYWECYVRQLTLSVYHPVGTCKIGSYNDNQTVVLRSNFQVKNIRNLYVVDASVMPNLPSGNPNSVVMMIAKKFVKFLLSTNENRFEIEETQIRHSVKHKIRDSEL